MNRTQENACSKWPDTSVDGILLSSSDFAKYFTTPAASGGLNPGHGITNRPLILNGCGKEVTVAAVRQTSLAELRAMRNCPENVSTTIVTSYLLQSIVAKLQGSNPWFVLKQFWVHHCFLGRPNPGGWIVGSADTPLNYDAPDYLNVFVATIRHL